MTKYFLAFYDTEPEDHPEIREYLKAFKHIVLASAETLYARAEMSEEDIIVLKIKYNPFVKVSSFEQTPKVF